MTPFVVHSIEKEGLFGFGRHDGPGQLDDAPAIRSYGHELPDLILSGKVPIGSGQALDPAIRPVPFWNTLALGPSDEHVSTLDNPLRGSGCPGPRRGPCSATD